jgi:hypothetical protein
MASSWGSAWGSAWGDSWGVLSGSKLRHRRVYEIEEPWNDDDDVFLIIKKIVLSGILDR